VCAATVRSISGAPDTGWDVRAERLLQRRCRSPQQIKPENPADAERDRLANRLLCAARALRCKKNSRSKPEQDGKENGLRNSSDGAVMSSSRFSPVDQAAPDCEDRLARPLPSIGNEPNWEREMMTVGLGGPGKLDSMPPVGRVLVNERLTLNSRDNRRQAAFLWVESLGEPDIC
jgi:hypothetical protein